MAERGGPRRRPGSIVPREHAASPSDAVALLRETRRCPVLCLHPNAFTKLVWVPHPLGDDAFELALAHRREYVPPVPEGEQTASTSRPRRDVPPRCLR